MTNITNEFIDSLYLLFSKDLPASVIKQAKLCLLDYYGCAYLGSSMLRNDITTYLEKSGSDCGKAEIIGFDIASSMQTAALLNGIMAHVAELDDGHRYGMMHPGAPVISSLLAVSQSLSITGNQFLKGIAAGYEAAVRLASAIQPGHKLRGYHATGTCGTIGAAMGIGIALQYSRQQLKTVLSASSSDAAGLLELIDNTSTMKAYNIGRAASAAVHSALMGETSFKGPEDVLGGKRGFLSVLASDIRPEYLTKGIDGKYAIETIYRKPYAACRHCHPAIEAMLLLKKEHSLSPSAINHINIYTYDLAIRGHEHTQITGSNSAKMSMPYSVAAALLFGSANFQQFTHSSIREVEECGIMDKITILEDPAMSAAVPDKRSAQLTIETLYGTFSKQIDYPKGEPENPISEEELEDKFISLLTECGSYSKVYIDSKLTEIKDFYKG